MAATLVWAAAAVAAAALALVALRPHLAYSHQPMLSEVPSFLLCETDWGSPCSATRPTRWLQDFHQALARRAADVAEGGGRPTVVHVGAANFGEDAEEYAPLLAAINSLDSLMKKHVRLILLEPEDEHQVALQNAYGKLGVDAADVTVVTAAVKERCNTSEVQYLFSEQLSADFAPSQHRSTVRSSLNTWRSFDRGHLCASVQAVADEQKAFTSGEGSSKAWDTWHNVIVPVVLKIHAAGNCTDYIVERPVRCLAPSGFVSETGLALEDLVMMTTDTEGFDVEILKGFIELQGFRPMLLRWEGTPHTSVPIVKFLQGLGYFVGVSGHSHSRDVVAYRGPAI